MDRRFMRVATTGPLPDTDADSACLRRDDLPIVRGPSGAGPSFGGIWKSRPPSINMRFPTQISQRGLTAAPVRTVCGLICSPWSCTSPRMASPLAKLLAALVLAAVEFSAPVTAQSIKLEKMDAPPPLAA